MKKRTLLIYLIIALVVGNVLIAIAASSVGTKLNLVEKEVLELEAEKMDLSQIVVKERSLTKVGEDAVELGMAKPEVTLYLSEEKPVARISETLHGTTD